MALQVWLPLNGDLKNKGCADVTVVNNGATVDNSGKIGKCYSFNGSSYINSGFVENFGTGDFTLSAWIYLTQTSGKTYQCIIGNKAQAAASVGCAIYWHQGQKKFMWSTANGSASSEIWTSETFDTIIYNSWHHIAMVRNNNDDRKGYFYIDGVRKEITSIPAIRDVSSTTEIKIGAMPSNNAYYFTGKINDVRIYNYAISEAEAKKLSQGLILHYKLNSNNPNGVQFYEYLEKSSAAGTKDYIDTGISGFTINNIRCVCKVSINDTRDSAFFGNRGSYYVFYNLGGNYFWPQSKAETSFNTLSINTNYIVDYNKGHFTVIDEFGTLYQEAYRSGTTVQSGNLYIFNFNPTDSRTSQSKIYYFKIYVNDILVRDFLPCSYLGEPGFWDLVENKFYGNVTEGTFTLGPISNTTICDSSGYGHHGSVTGSLFTNLETPRYNKCLDFESSKITSENLNLPGDSVFTISCWIKLLESKTYQPIFWIGDGTTSHGICAHGNGAGRLEGGNGTNKFDKNLINIGLNAWTHIAIVYNGTEIKQYLNGVLSNNFVSYTYGFGNTLTRLYIGYFWGGYCSSSISDFRIYSTVLSADDILRLYQVSAKIDNLGNVHSYEIDEYLDEGRELLVRNITGSYSNTTSHRSNSLTFNGNSSAGSEYIEINPAGKKYIYDFTLSVAAGNQFDLGFERYDANKTARSNQACVYVYATKSSTDIVEKRFKGVVDLSTDGTNPCKYIRLRILNAWSGSDSNTVGTATVHQLSLREVSTSSTAKTRLLKTGVFETDLLREGNTKATIEKDVDMNINEFIET